MTNDNTTTATVETLTAEVRVLMYGNRQVTQALAKQLDRVELDRLDMFGRVRLGGRDGDTLVIGRRADGTDLVIADPGEYDVPTRFVATLRYSGPDHERSTSTDPSLNGHRRSNIYIDVRLDSVPCLIDFNDVAYDSSVRDAFVRAHHEWIHRRHEFWKANGTTTGFDELDSAPVEPTYTWNPGPHEDEFRRQIAEQRAEHDRRHVLYEKACALPLIVLAGLR